MTYRGKKHRDPGDIAEYDQMKAEMHGQIERLHNEARQVAEEGHDELCLVAFFYTRTMDRVHTREDIHRLVQLLAFTLVQGADLPNKDQIGCVH